MSGTKISRRNFVKLGTAVAGAAALGGSAEAMELGVAGESVGIEHGPEDTVVAGSSRSSVKTICFVCNIRDGCEAFIENGRLVKLEGNSAHPGNRGKLCPKGNAGMLHLYNPDRLLHPVRRAGPRGSGRWTRVSWSDALSEVADKINEILEDENRDNDEIVFQHGRHLYDHDAEDRFNATVGSSSQWGHTSICESSKKMGLEPRWGADIELPDFQRTNFAMIFGANILEASYFMVPNHQRLADGHANGAKVVSFDVRNSNTQGFADEAFYLKAGTDGIIALAMCNVIMREGLDDSDFIEEQTNVSRDELADYLSGYTPAKAERYSGVPADDIERLAIEFATAAPAATTYSYRGPAQHENHGSIQETDIMLLNIVSGSVEQRGGYFFPRVGQVDGYADPFYPKHPEPYPDAPAGSGSGTGKEMYEPLEEMYPIAGHGVSHQVPHLMMWPEVAEEHGAPTLERIGLYFNHHIDQAYAYPDGDLWEEFLKDENLVELNVFTDLYYNETNKFADIILPETTYLESWVHFHSMPSAETSFYMIGQPAVAPLGETKDLDQMMIELFRDHVDPDNSKGIREFWDYRDSEEYLETIWRQVEEKNEDFRRAGGFDALKENGVWPVFDQDPETGRTIWADTGEELEYTEGGMLGSFGPAETETDGEIAVRSDWFDREGFPDMPYWIPSERHEEVDVGSGKLRLTTFKKIMHTQSVTSNLKWLQELDHKNPAWINPATASRLGIKDGDKVKIESDIGYIVTRAAVREGIRPEIVAVAHHAGHWNYGRYSHRDWESVLSGTSGITDQLGFSGGETHRFGGQDPDEDLMWWKDTGVHPNKIFPIITDPVGGGYEWFGPVVKVSMSSEAYGTVQYKGIEASRAAWERTLQYRTERAREEAKELAERIRQA